MSLPSLKKLLRWIDCQTVGLFSVLVPVGMQRSAYLDGSNIKMEL